MLVEGAAAACRLGGEYLARSADDRIRLDRRRRQEAARHAAQLGALSPSAASPRQPDPGEAAACQRQAAGVSGAAPKAPLGSWSCWTPTGCWRRRTAPAPFPTALSSSSRDKTAPPNRAYLKLWEALTLARPLAAAGRALPGSRRQPGRLELGAAIPGRAGHRRRQGAAGPGDRRPAAASNSRRRAPSRSSPPSVGPVDWLFSDVVCYPARLLRAWWSAGWSPGWSRNFVCTIKFQGETDHARGRGRFAAIPGARLMHLHHNKHELTWMRLAG